MSEERFLTKHPEGKRGVNISKAKYVVIREAIMKCLKSKELTYTELTRAVEEKLKGQFGGSVRWYVEVVKLDLEAREIIERIPKTKPHLYRTKEGKNRRKMG